MSESEAGARSMRKVLSESLASVASSSSVPFGYTVSIWGAGALLIHFRGTPGVGEVFLFAAGALMSFGCVALLARPGLGEEGRLRGETRRVLAGMMDWLAVGLALGAVALLSQIASWVAWPVASAAATVLYVLAASLQLALVSRHA